MPEINDSEPNHRQSVHNHEDSPAEIITGTDYNWHLAWAAGKVPQNDKARFLQEASARSMPDGKNNGIVRLAEVILFAILVIASAVFQFLILSVAETLNNRTPVLLNFNVLREFKELVDFDIVIAVNGIVITAITIWSFVSKRIKLQFDAMLPEIQDRKTRFIRECRDFVEKLDLQSKRAGNEQQSDHEESISKLHLKRRATDCEIKSLRRKLEVFDSRVSQLTTAESLIFFVTIASSASLLLVRMAVEPLTTSDGHNGSLHGAAAISISIPLILLHYLVFLVVWRDSMQHLELLKNERLTHDSRLPVMYLLRFVEFGSENSRLVTSKRSRSLAESIYVIVFGIVALACMTGFSFQPIPHSYASSFEQFIVTAAYVLIGLVVPNAILYSEAQSEASVVSAIKSESFNGLHWCIVGYCIILNVFVPLQSILAFPHPQDFFWYPWWNPFFSLCALWLSRCLVFCVLGSRIARSTSRFLSKLESQATDELASAIAARRRTQL